MSKPRLYSDFNGPLQPTYMLLTYVGTLRDLNTQKIVLREGMEVTVYSDSDEEHDIEMDGVVCFGEFPDGLPVSHPCWYVRTDAASFRYAKVKRKGESEPFVLPCFDCGSDIYQFLNIRRCPNCGLDAEHARRR